MFTVAVVRPVSCRVYVLNEDGLMPRSFFANSERSPITGSQPSNRTPVGVKIARTGEMTLVGYISDSVIVIKK